MYASGICRTPACPRAEGSFRGRPRTATVGTTVRQRTLSAAVSGACSAGCSSAGEATAPPGVSCGSGAKRCGMSTCSSCSGRPSAVEVVRPSYGGIAGSASPGASEAPPPAPADSSCSPLDCISTWSNAPAGRSVGPPPASSAPVSREPFVGSHWIFQQCSAWTCSVPSSCQLEILTHPGRTSILGRHRSGRDTSKTPTRHTTKSPSGDFSVEETSSTVIRSSTRTPISWVHGPSGGGIRSTQPLAPSWIGDSNTVPVANPFCPSRTGPKMWIPFLL